VPLRNPFDYVPPEDRSPWLRRFGFVAAVAMVLIGAVLLGVCGYGLAFNRPAYFAPFRFAVGFFGGGIALWQWLKEDPRRR
jgi:hypothetical protein